MHVKDAVRPSAAALASMEVAFRALTPDTILAVLNARAQHKRGAVGRRGRSQPAEAAAKAAGAKRKASQEQPLQDADTASGDDRDTPPPEREASHTPRCPTGRRSWTISSRGPRRRSSASRPVGRPCGPPLQRRSPTSSSCIGRSAPEAAARRTTSTTFQTSATSAALFGGLLGRRRHPRRPPLPRTHRCGAERHPSSREPSPR